MAEDEVPAPPRPPPLSRPARWLTVGAAAILVVCIAIAWGGLRRGPLPDPLGYGQTVSTTVRSTWSGEDVPVQLTYPWCHYVGVPAGQAWLAARRAELHEDEQGGLRQAPDERKQRDQRCLSPYYLSSLHLPTATVALAQEGSQPLIVDALIHGTLAMPAYVAALRAAAAEQGRAGVARQSPLPIRLFWQPSPHADQLRHYHQTGWPGRLLYRASVLLRDGHLWPRLVDHSLLAILLDAWTASVVHRMDALGMQLRERLCVCPAHLGLFGLPMLITRAHEENRWRFWLNATATAMQGTRADPRGWPLPSEIGPFPAAMDEAFLRALGPDRSRLDVEAETMLFSGYDVGAVGPLARLIGEGNDLVALTARLAERAQEAEPEEDGQPLLTPAQRLASLVKEARLGAGRSPVKALANLDVRAALGPPPHDLRADREQTRCFSYCGHLEQWLLQPNDPIT